MERAHGRNASPNAEARQGAKPGSPIRDSTSRQRFTDTGAAEPRIEEQRFLPFLSMLLFLCPLHRRAVPLVTAFLAFLPPTVPGLLAQGPLVPTGEPASSMRTLAQIEPRIPIESLTGDSTAQYVINSSGSYYLSVGNLTGVSGKATIAINADGVSIDLNGFSLVGGRTRGVEIRGAYSNLAIRNGGIYSCSAAGVGISTGNAPTGVLLEHLTIASVSGAGIDLTAGNAITVSHCSVSGAVSGIVIGNTGSTVQNCSVANLVTAGAQAWGIFAGSVSHCEVNTILGSGQSNSYGILGRVVLACNVSNIDTGGPGISVGIQADTVTGCTANSIGQTASGVSEGIGANTVSACSVSTVGGTSSASVQYGISSSGLAVDCTVSGVGNSSSHAFIYGVSADVTSRCRVSVLSSTSSLIGISARVVTTSAVSNIVQLGVGTGSLSGINGERVSDCQVDSILTNSLATSLGIYAKRAIGGSAVSGVSNLGSGGSFGVDLGLGAVAEHCQVTGASTTGIRAQSNAKITQCEVSGATITIGIDCQAAGSLVDGNNVFGCTTGIKAVGTSLVTRNHVTNSSTKFNVAAAGQLGPISNIAGTIAGTISPWANFTD